MATGMGSGRFLDNIEHNRSERDFFLKNKSGDVITGDSKIPKGDFAHFLGGKERGEGGLADGGGHPPGHRVLEAMLERGFDKVGTGAVEVGSLARNVGVSHGMYENQVGRSRDLVKDGLDASKEMDGSELLQPGSLGSSSSSQYMKMMQTYQERSSETNMRYLEIQYKFLNASKSHSTISNLMKVRHEATRTAIREVK